MYNHNNIMMFLFLDDILLLCNWLLSQLCHRICHVEQLVEAHDVCFVSFFVFKLLASY